MRFNRFLTTVLAALGVVTSIGAPAWAQATTPAAQLQRWQAAAGLVGVNLLNMPHYSGRA